MHISFYSSPTEQIPWHERAGQNSKHTLVLAVHSEVPEHLPFLKKILRAVDLDFEADISFLPVDEQSMLQLFADPMLAQYRHVLLFGLQPARIGLTQLQESQPCVLHFEKVTCLYSPKLAEIAQQPAMKKQLWSALKEVFEPAQA